MKITEKTRRLVLEQLDIRGKLSVRDVTDLLGVSEVTIRRLFIKLEEEGVAIRTFGGITRTEVDKYLYSFIHSNQVRFQEKVFIGQAAAKEVNSGDQIFLDSGTTILAMARALAVRLDAGELMGLQVLTNSLIIPDVLANKCKVILAGGEIRSERRDVCGYLAEEFLKRLHVRTAFLGCDALDLVNGLMTTDERTAHINEIVISNSDQIYILADSSKIGTTSFVSYGSLKIIDTLVSDSGLTETYRRKLSSIVGRILIPTEEKRNPG